jgi:hypothetical protein
MKDTTFIRCALRYARGVERNANQSCAKYGYDDWVREELHAARMIREALREAIIETQRLESSEGES